MSNLNDAKVGDEIAIKQYGRWVISKITTATKTQVGDRNYRYMRRFGKRIGSGGSAWSASHYAHLVTDELRQRIAAELAAEASGLRLRNVSRALGNVGVTAANVDRIEAFLKEISCATS